MYMYEMNKEYLIKRLEQDANSLNAISHRPEIADLPCYTSITRAQADIMSAIAILKGGDEMK